MRLQQPQVAATHPPQMSKLLRLASITFSIFSPSLWVEGILCAKYLLGVKNHFKEKGPDWPHIEGSR